MCLRLPPLSTLLVLALAVAGAARGATPPALKGHSSEHPAAPAPAPAPATLGKLAHPGVSTGQQPATKHPAKPAKPLRARPSPAERQRRLEHLQRLERQAAPGGIRPRHILVGILALVFAGLYLRSRRTPGTLPPGERPARRGLLPFHQPRPVVLDPRQGIDPTTTYLDDPGAHQTTPYHPDHAKGSAAAAARESLITNDLDRVETAAEIDRLTKENDLSEHAANDTLAGAAADRSTSAALPADQDLADYAAKAPAGDGPPAGPMDPAEWGQFAARASAAVPPLAEVSSTGDADLAAGHGEPLPGGLLPASAPSAAGQGSLPLPVVATGPVPEIKLAIASPAVDKAPASRRAETKPPPMPATLAVHFEPLADERVLWSAPFRVPYVCSGMLAITNQRLLSVHRQPTLHWLPPRVETRERRHECPLSAVTGWASETIRRKVFLVVGGLVCLWYPGGTIVACLALGVFFAWPRTEFAVWSGGVRRLYPLELPEQQAARQLLDALDLKKP